MTSRRPKALTPAVVLVLLAVAAAVLLGRNALVELSQNNRPVRSRIAEIGRDVRWYEAEWRALSIADGTLPADLRDQLPARTRVVESVVAITPTEAFTEEGDRNCEWWLVAADGRRWRAGDLVPYDSDFESSTCLTAVQGKAAPLSADKRYEIRNRFLVPASVDPNELDLEVRMRRKTTRSLRFVRP